MIMIEIYVEGHVEEKEIYVLMKVMLRKELDMLRRKRDMYRGKRVLLMKVMLWKELDMLRRKRYSTCIEKREFY